MKEWMTHHVRPRPPPPRSHAQINSQFTPKYNELYQSSYPNGQQARVEAWHLLLIVVRPAYQRRGLGRALVSVLREMVSLSVIVVVTDTDPHSSYRPIASRNV
jgi:GNAT superfamily N-acetyltransferase